MPAGWAAAAVAVYGAYDNKQQQKKNRKANADAQRDENDWRQRGLTYQIEQDKLPTQFRNNALTRLNKIYAGGEGQNQFIQEAKSSELYKNLMSTGEESILRNASATGGLRSGNVQNTLADFSKSALLDTYNSQLSGIQGMAGLPSNANAINNSMANIGTANSQAIMAQRAMDQQSNQNMQNLIGQGVQAYAAYQYSDIRAKDKIRFIGKENGFNIYSWRWNKVGKFLGLSGKGRGVLAHEIHKTHPEAILVKNGILMVDYGKLGVSYA
ncbi:MAG: hypothetical protein ACC707_01605 [Thiohalomonadales bacterium]